MTDELEYFDELPQPERQKRVYRPQTTSKWIRIFERLAAGEPGRWALLETYVGRGSAYTAVRHARERDVQGLFEFKVIRWPGEERLYGRRK